MEREREIEIERDIWRGGERDTERERVRERQRVKDRGRIISAYG